jgi:hypothetical protein
MRTGSNRLGLIFTTPGVPPQVPTTAYESKPNFRLQKVLRSPDSCEDFLETLLEIFHTDNQFKDIALLNLLCAPRIKGAEDLDIPQCLDWLDGLTRHVKGAIDRDIHNYRSDPDYGNCLPKWLMFILVSVIKKQYGATYNPVVKANKNANKISPMDNARDVFLNGLLDEDRKHRHGTCASFPVLVAAIARRLNYPVRLAVAGRHIFARWDGDGVRFNIESTGPMGMVIHSDEHYRDEYVPDEYKDNAYFLRTLTAEEEFGLFMTFRVECLVYAGRSDETLLWSARAMQFAPDDPFMYWSLRGFHHAMEDRYKRSNPGVATPKIETVAEFDSYVRPLLTDPEISLYLTITGRIEENKADLTAARRLYEDSCRAHFHGNNEQRDLQRFLKKYDLPRHPRPLMPPKYLREPRWFKLPCGPQEEASLLRKMANQFYGNREYLKSHNALEDLYMFDPGDAEVFQGARKIAKMPEYQTQLKAAIAEQRRKQN